MALNVSVFASITQTTPQIIPALSWEQLVTMLGPPKAYLTKEAAPLYSPSEWLPGHTRGKAGIVCVHFGVLDLDHWTSDAVGELVSRLTSRRLAYLLASTWSHGLKGPEDICARLLVPFSRPVLPSEWQKFWPALDEEITSGRADPMCKDISRSYFFPAFRQGGFEPFSDGASGAPVDVDAILARVGGAARGGVEEDVPAHPDGGVDVTRDELKALGRKLAGSANANKVVVGNAILRMCKGEAYAKEPNTPGPLPEGRNDTTFRMVATICEHYPFVEPGKLASHFVASIQEMLEPTIEQIEAMITRQQAGARSAHATLIQEALGRNDPYSDAELQTFADMLDISRSRMRRRWIVQRDRSYYIFKNGDYKHFFESEVTNAAMVALAPAIRAGVDTQKITQQGVKQKTAEDLVRDYGVIAQGGVEVDLSAQFARFDEHRAVMIEAPTPLRVKPRRHDDVAEWLKVFGGTHHDKLLQWIAVLPALTEPCAALYLEGPGNTGKSLLANGLCRLWAYNLTTLHEVIGGQFNEPLSRCPLVLGDEKAPADQRGRIRTDELREFIQARARPFARKFKPNAIITGCARVILAANNRNLIQTSEHLTPEDIDAIVARIFYLKVPIESSIYLDKIRSTSLATLDRWVKGDAMAEHALYLAETINVPRTHRFLVPGESSDLTNTLAVTTGLRARVCEWLTNFLLEPKKIRQYSHLAPLVRVSKGRLLVNAKAVTDTWRDYVRLTNEGDPGPMQVARALGGLSTPITLRLDTGNVQFRSVHLDLVVAWGEETGYAMREKIENAMAALEHEYDVAERKAMS